VKLRKTRALDSAARKRSGVLSEVAYLLSDSQVLSMLQMLLQSGKRLSGPCAQCGIVALRRIGLEQVDRVLVSLDLHLLIAAVEVGAGGGLELAQHLRMLLVELARERLLSIALLHERLQLVRGLGMVLDHRGRKFCTLAFLDISAASRLDWTRICR
jgi:hypothetical protein